MPSRGAAHPSGMVWDPKTGKYVPRGSGDGGTNRGAYSPPQSSPQPGDEEDPDPYEITSEANIAAGQHLRTAGQQAGKEMEGVLEGAIGQYSDVDRRTRELYGPGGALAGPGVDERLLNEQVGNLTDKSAVESMYESRLAGGDPYIERLREQAKRSLAESFGGGGGVGNARKEAESLNLLELGIMDQELKRLEGLAQGATDAERQRLETAFGAAGDVEEQRIHRVGSELDVLGRSAAGKGGLVGALGPQAVQYRAEGEAALAAGNLKGAEAIAMKYADEEFKRMLANAKSDEEKEQLMNTLFGAGGAGIGWVASGGNPLAAAAGWSIGDAIGDAIF